MVPPSGTGSRSTGTGPAFIPRSTRKSDPLNDSSARESARPAPGPNDDHAVAALASVLRRLAGSELASCCGLAVLARELSGGRPCRVELSGGHPGASARENGPDRGSSGESEPGRHRLPVRGPGTPGEPEAWLTVALRGDESAPPGLERLSSLAAVAGLVLERHRLDREVRRARGEAEEARAVLAHALRGHLHAALLRTENLLVAVRRDGSPDFDEVREQLRLLKGTVGEMVEEIRQAVDARDAPGEGRTGPGAGRREEVDVPGMLREAADAVRDGEGAPLRVDVEGSVPAVRTDPRQLRSAFGELLDLARRARNTPTLAVRPRGPASGARIDLSVELPPLSGSGAGPQGHGTDADPSPGDAGSGASSGKGREVDDPSLRDLVARLGGRLWVEAGEGGLATVVVTLPTGDVD